MNNLRREMVKKAGSRQEYYMFEVSQIPGSRVPRYARLTFVEIKPRSGQERKVYLPLIGKFAILEALNDNADIFNYADKPYADSEWLIGYWISRREQDMVESITNLIVQVLKLAEIADSEEI